MTRKQLWTLHEHDIIVRVFPDTYRLTAVPRSNEQQLRAALAWAGQDAVAAGRSAGELYGLEGIRAGVPEITVPPAIHTCCPGIVVYRGTPRALMVRRVRGLRVGGVECTLVQLAACVDSEVLEIAAEDARRRQLTSVPALRRYLDRHGRSGRPGVRAIRQLVAQLDPRHPARSTLEVKTRRLLVANGITAFEREFPLEWNGHTYLYDFAFRRQRTILETNGRRWHDDPVDHEFDNEKWSVPGRHGYRMVFATWAKVTKHPDALLHELATTMAA